MAGFDRNDQRSKDVEQDDFDQGTSNWDKRSSGMGNQSDYTSDANSDIGGGGMTSGGSSGSGGSTSGSIDVDRGTAGSGQEDHGQGA
jgi:hypothetical protein